VLLQDSGEIKILEIPSLQTLEESKLEGCGIIADMKPSKRNNKEYIFATADGVRLASLDSLNRFTMSQDEIYLKSKAITSIHV
jgi:hypothetical protein